MSDDDDDESNTVIEMVFSIDWSRRQFDDRLSRFDTIPACDRQTDRRTDRRPAYS